MSQLPSQSPVTDLRTLLSTLHPIRHHGTFVYATVSAGPEVALHEVVAMVREPDGLSVVVSDDTARRLGLVAQFPCAWLTLTVHSALQAIGLTAAVAAALADEGIPCNVVAGTQHDHLFVPRDMATRAMQVLQSLQQRSARESSGT